MKKSMPWIMLTAMAGSALFGQSLTGTWQGTLQPPRSDKGLRVVFKIATTDADKLKATFYSIDQGGQAIAVNAVTQSGTSVKISLTAIGSIYEGKLSTDGNSMAGSWNQGAAIPLNLARATPDTEWSIPEPPPPAKVMPADATPSFEVATIKPSRAEERFSLTVNRSGMMNTTASSLSDLIKFAYDLHPREISGGPSWYETEKYDVTGKPDTAGMPSVKQLKGMVQKLLTERFALAFHREKKELSVYAITIGKGGHKMTINDSNPKGLPGFGGGGVGGMYVRNATMAELGHVMQANVMERPVVDQTDLGGTRFDFVLKWTPDASHMPLGALDGPPAPVANNPDGPPDIFAAFEQQLGLRLQATKAPVDVMVIDHVEKPSPN